MAYPNPHSGGYRIDNPWAQPGSSSPYNHHFGRDHVPQQQQQYQPQVYSAASPYTQQQAYPPEPPQSPSHLQVSYDSVTSSSRGHIYPRASSTELGRDASSFMPIEDEAQDEQDPYQRQQRGLSPRQQSPRSTPRSTPRRGPSPEPSSSTLDDPEKPLKWENLSEEERRIASTFPQDLDEQGSSVKESVMKYLRNWRSFVAWKYWYYYVCLILFIVACALFAIYHRKIIDWLTPVSKKVNSVKWGWVIPVAIMFIISFPPLFGHEIVAVLCGIVYPFWEAFGIVALGTLLGELGNFWAFMWCFRRLAEKYERKSLNYACMAHIVREGGFMVILVARLSAIPGHFTTAVFATVGMSVWIFTLAATLSLPKQLAVVYVGKAIADSGTGEESTQSKIVKYVVLVISAIITLAAAWYLYDKMEKARPIVQSRLKVKRHTMLVEARRKSGTPGSSTDVRVPILTALPNGSNVDDEGDLGGSMGKLTASASQEALYPPVASHNQRLPPGGQGYYEPEYAVNQNHNAAAAASRPQKRFSWTPWKGGAHQSQPPNSTAATPNHLGLPTGDARYNTSQESLLSSQQHHGNQGLPLRNPYQQQQHQQLHPEDSPRDEKAILLPDPRETQPQGQRQGQIGYVARHLQAERQHQPQQQQQQQFQVDYTHTPSPPQANANATAVQPLDMDVLLAATTARRTPQPQERPSNHPHPHRQSYRQATEGGYSLYSLGPHGASEDGSLVDPTGGAQGQGPTHSQYASAVEDQLPPPPAYDARYR